MSSGKEAYAECKHIKREVPDITVSKGKIFLKLDILNQTLSFFKIVNADVSKP